MTGPHTFGDKETRKDDMSDAIEEWVADLADSVEDAHASEEFTEYLDVMSNFHTYSPNNQFLIKAQYPEATKVAGFNTWKDDFNRTVKKGESAIWIWAPLTSSKCPECGNSPSYHENIDCDEDSDPDEWSTGVVGFRPVPVFDVSQTEGEELPELDTEAHGDADGLLDAILAASDSLGVPEVTVTSEENWEHGSARGVSKTKTGEVDILDRENKADKVRTIAHEYAHSMLHVDDKNREERSKREVEAESVAYIFGRHFGLDVDGSAFYLASWSGEEPEAIEERMDRISKTAQDLIEAVETKLDTQEQEATQIASTTA